MVDIYKQYTDFIKNTHLTLSPEQWYFKNNPNYSYMLEHVNYNQGVQYLHCIKRDFGEFYNKNEQYLKELCEMNDKYGRTIKNTFANFMTCSPTNLRYIYFSLLSLSHMIKCNINETDIIEIGGGYGGLCLFILKIAPLMNIKIKSYTIFDLDEPLILQKKYLESHGCNDIKYYHLKNFGELQKNSFLVSTFAFSEIPSIIQQEYTSKILNIYVSSGFIAWNNIPLYKFIEGCNIENRVEEPLTNPSGFNKYVFFNKSN